MSDLIDRQAVIDALDEIEAEVADGYGYQYAKWREYFVEMPSAQPQRKTGRWVNIDESEKWECSVCGRMMWFSPRLNVKPSDYRFCPNCGADMRGEQDDSI